MSKKITINCSEQELRLIEKALELYTRVGLLQFEKLTECSSLQKLIWDKDLVDKFEKSLKEVKALFGYTLNSSPGIFNISLVKDDVRIAADMIQSCRHARYLNDKKEEGDNPIFKLTNASSPADICKIAKIPEPEFEITIEN